MTSDFLVIRKAEEEDAAEVLALIRELAIFERQPDVVVISEEDIVKNAFGESPLIYILIAELEHRVVGMALYYFSFSTWKGKSLHLEDLIVREAFRGQGIGKRLVKEVLQIAERENVGRVSWEVLDWNKPAIKLYESLNTHFYKDWWLCRLFKEDIERLNGDT